MALARNTAPPNPDHVVGKDPPIETCSTAQCGNLRSLEKSPHAHLVTIYLCHSSLERASSQTLPGDANIPSLFLSTLSFPICRRPCLHPWACCLPKSDRSGSQQTSEEDGRASLLGSLVVFLSKLVRFSRAQVPTMSPMEIPFLPNPYGLIRESA
jgi:hypothetical protein